ncbi:MAG: hypothetical protein ACI4S3_04970 [Candidatus Gastranaerophilaceae bacterium]
MIKLTLDRGIKYYGKQVTLTWFTPKIIQALEDENIRLQNPIVPFESRQVYHSLGDRKNIKQRVTQTQLKNIYDYINKPDEIYIDTVEHAVVYVKYLPKDEIIDGRDCIKIPVPINTKDKKRPVNFIGTLGRIPSKSLKEGKRFKKIE